MYAYLATALIAAVVAGAGAWQVQSWRFDAKEKTRLEMEAKEQMRKAERIDQAAVRHEADKKRIETKYVQVLKEVPREVEKVVYRNVCISPDGVRNINDLIDTYDAGQPPTGVPEAGAPAERGGQ
jgi:hypothetical protein